MGATFRFNGDEIPHTPSSAVTAGDVVVVGEFVGVAKNDIAASADGVLSVVGIYDVNILSTVTFAAGDIAYWDEAEGEATNDDDDAANKQIGLVTVASSAAGADTAIRLSR
jgi:predicted RecA/RadA family phage recombinase